MDDAAIHRVLENAGGYVLRLRRARGSPRPQGARDDKGEKSDDKSGVGA